MRIAIVNDSKMEVETLRRIVLTVAEYEIAWIANDGAEAISMCAKDTPDLILMNLLMPVMDGVDATRQIMKSSPCAILVVTANVKDNTDKVFEALGYGAIDAVSMPILGTSGQSRAGMEELLGKISTVRKLLGKTRPKSPVGDSGFDAKQVPLVVIGSSTGGPKALATVLSNLPKNINAAIAIVQHVDVQFSSGLVNWLNGQTALQVELANPGSRFEVGKVLVAGTNDHLILQSNGKLAYTADPRDYPYRPSVDVFFKSIAQYWQRKGIAVLLTGMGRDGAEGLSLLRAKGWHTIAQDQSTSVVYGMPKAAVELNAAVEILPIDAIAPAIIKNLARIR